MAIRSGIAGQVGIAAETTWGTYQAPDHWIEPTTESMKYAIARLDSRGLRANDRFMRADRWITNRFDVNGDLEFEVRNKGMGLIFKHMLGTSAITADGAGFRHKYTPGDPYGLGLTVQVGRPDTGGTVRAFSYTGCKIISWELSNSVDNFLALRCGFDGKQELTNQTLGVASYPTNVQSFSFLNGAITIAGSSSYNITGWTLSNTIGQKQDRYFVGGAGLKAQQIINALMEPTGTLTAEFTDLTGYTLFTSGTIANVTLTYDTGIAYDTGKTYRCIITLPAVRFDGDTPNLSGEDIVSIPLNYKVLDDGTNPPIQIDYYTTDAAD